MIKLIVSDMDGTLLSDEKKLPSDFWETEKRLHEKGIIFAIASGRQYYNLIEVFDTIKDRMLFLAENGTYVFYNGDELFVNPLDRNRANEIIKTAREIPDCYIILCGKNAAYIENSDERFLTTLFQHYSKVETTADLTTVDDSILKVTLCDFRNSETNSFTYFNSFKNDCKVTVSGKNWVDITDMSANKGNALLKIQEKLKISNDETVVFGDFMNDFEMMSNATNSYAMKNAHPEILRISKFATDFDNNNNGVTEIINKLIR